MSVSSSAIGRTQQLRCVVPQHWRQIASGPLIDAAAGLVPEEEQGNLRRVFAQMIRNGLAFAALRIRSEGRIMDVLTVAVPPVDEESKAVSSRARMENAPDDDVVHRNEPPAAGFSASLQLVRLVPPSDRGVIVTIVSTERGGENALIEDLRAFADTLELT